MMNSSEDQFAAALAHQLNTPIATMEAASTNLRRNLRGLLEELAAMAGIERNAGATALFVSRVVNEPAPSPQTGLLPQDRLNAIGQRLAAEGVEGDLPSAASSLLRGGWDTYLDEIVPLLRRDQVRTLDLLETAARLRANVAAVEVSVQKVRGLSGALRLLAQSADGEPFEVRSDLENAAVLVRETLPGGVRIDMRLEPIPPVRGRAELMSEVWMNLIVNAAQAVGRQGTITVETATGPRSKEQGSGSAIVRVLDDGPGIAGEVLPRIFEPHFTTRGADGGSGLGLPLARSIVERMGGRIDVESRPGRTCFTVVLPSAAATATGGA
ncbi:MAG TPA: sensor histidine kinase [Candidatus Polarisedimenticolia bacterium]|jgi:signal transduction histidine kinase